MVTASSRFHGVTHRWGVSVKTKEKGLRIHFCYYFVQTQDGARLFCVQNAFQRREAEFRWEDASPLQFKYWMGFYGGTFR